MTTTQTLIICSECGQGRYMRHLWYFQCTECAHSVTESDIDLEAGESLTYTSAGLAYTTIASDV